MHKALLVLVGTVAVVAMGFAVAGLASSGSSTGGLAGTSETTSESTTETAKPTKWATTLGTGQEVPKPKGVKPGATGTFTVAVTEKGAAYSGKYTLTFRNLTGRAMAAHIHRGKVGKTGPVVLALCGPCTSGRTANARVSKTVLAAMKAGSAYVNVHTARNAAGEIRGQVRRKTG